MTRLCSVALALALWLTLGFGAAWAVSTVTVPLSSTAYTSLGAGPLTLGATGGTIDYQISDTQPSATSPGFSIKSGGAPVSISTTSQVWAMSIGATPASALVTGGVAIGQGNVTATLSGFAPASVGTPISATTSGATGSLPAGTTVLVENVGSYPAYCQLGASTSGITSSKSLAASGGQWAIAPGSATQITCEGVGGTTTINLLGGSGLGVDTAGASSGGGGGGTVTQGSPGSAANAWFVVQTQGGSLLSATNGGYTNLLQNNAALSATNGLYFNLLVGNAANAAGNPIFAQLTAGTAIVGKFGFDQTTPGTTNGVSLAQIGANTVSVGAGATGTGTQRVGVAQDTTTIAGSAPGTAGSPSANVVTVQGASGGTALPVAPAPGGAYMSASFNAGPIANTPTVSTSAYTANYAIGGLQTVSVFRTTAQASGVLATVGLASKGGLTTTEALYAFTKSPASTCTDHAAFALSSADLPYLVPGFPVSLTPASLAGTTQTTASAVANVPAKNADSSATTNLYFCAVTTGTPTPASTSDLVFTYTVLQD